MFFFSTGLLLINSGRCGLCWRNAHWEPGCTIHVWVRTTEQLNCTILTLHFSERQCDKLLEACEWRLNELFLGRSTRFLCHFVRSDLGSDMRGMYSSYKYICAIQTFRTTTDKEGHHGQIEPIFVNKISKYLCICVWKAVSPDEQMRRHKLQGMKNKLLYLSSDDKWCLVDDPGYALLAC